jgi:hypothetical protein
MIIKTRHSPRYIFIAVPDLIECVPMSSFLKPNFALLIAPTASCSAFLAWLDVTCLMIPWLKTVEIGEFWDVPGYFLILFTPVS